MTATTLRGVLPVAVPSSCFEPGRAHGTPLARQTDNSCSTREVGASFATTTNLASPAASAACAAARPEASVFARCASPRTAIQRGGVERGPLAPAAVAGRNTSAS